jgi:hypothetical protein
LGENALDQAESAEEPVLEIIKTKAVHAYADRPTSRIDETGQVTAKSAAHKSVYRGHWVPNISAERSSDAHRKRSESW